MNKKIHLVCDDTIFDLDLRSDETNRWGGSIISNLHGNEWERELASGADSFGVAVDVLESLILAHACAGVNIESDDYKKGLQVTLEVVGDRYTEEE